ncbi:hypothetical protein FH972_023254 [Carpinus fangiana]|uniref:Uncharacterized protein n=1 Tax=Carpinus fangiana TaxID=176857 RepID=A0A5N6KUP1_9ROSI|nr:hypothetical protein FH972_023254 [Carpinus fangiana]
MVLPPTLSVALDIDPRSFEVDRTTPQPSISITVTSHTAHPITIFIWPHVFNLSLSQKRDNFTCLDITSNTWLFLPVTAGPKRPGFKLEQGSYDEKYIYTLEPETPMIFKGDFGLARRIDDDIHTLIPGHRYRLSIREGEAVSWWRWGRKDDIIPPVGQPQALDKADGDPLVLQVEGPVEFSVE